MFRPTSIRKLLLAVSWTPIVSAFPAAALPQDQPLATGVTYLGAFTIPYDDGRDTSPASRLSWSKRGPLAVDNGTIWWACHDQNPSSIAKVSIPALGGTSTVLSPCSPVPNLQAISPTEPGEIKPGGALAYNGKLIVSEYVFYDAGHAAEKSHYTGTTIANLQGPFRLGPLSGAAATPTDRVGMQAAYMGLVPVEWRPLLGWPAFTGMAGGTASIVTRLSYGPTLTGFDPDQVGGVRSIQMLLGYPTEHHDLGDWDQVTPYRATAGATYGGFAFPNGSRSVLFVGSSGEAFCYGKGTDIQSLHGQPVPNDPPWIYCWDPLQVGTNGVHGYPRLTRLWHYDANDLLAVKTGSRQPWDLRPTLLPMTGPLSNVPYINGAAYDQANNRWYIYDGGPEAKVYVYRVDLGGGSNDPAPAPPQNFRNQ